MFSLRYIMDIYRLFVKIILKLTVLSSANASTSPRLVTRCPPDISFNATRTSEAFQKVP